MSDKVEFLEECEYIYDNGSPETVECCKFFVSTTKNAIQLKQVINDAYLFEPKHSTQPYRRH